MITIICASRVGVTNPEGPYPFIKKLIAAARDVNNFEIIIRCDDDDTKMLAIKMKIEKISIKPIIKFKIGPRSRGYESLTNFYNECLPIRNQDHKMIMVLAEDIEVLNSHWDEKLIKTYRHYKVKFKHTIFTLHATLLPGLSEHYESYIEDPDSFIVYTSEWLLITGGVGLVANDSWTLGIHYYLYNEFGLDVRGYSPDRLFIRQSNPLVDSMHAKRWSNARLRNHNLLRQPRMKKHLQSQAEALFSHINVYYKINALNFHALSLGNFLANKYGAKAIFYRLIHNMAKTQCQSRLIKAMNKINERLNYLLRCKQTVSYVYAELNYLYTPIESDIANLAKPYNVSLLELKGTTRKIYDFTPAY